MSVLAAAGKVPFPPGVGDFYLPSLVHGAGPWLTKFTLLLWVSAAVVIIFFLVAYRNPKLVPGRMQWLAESIYGFTRNGLAKEAIGPEGVRFAPYLTSLLCFILVTNVFGIIPFLQVSPNAHIAFPAMLAVLTYLLYLYVGFRKHGFLPFLKRLAILPGAPVATLPLLIPIELAQNFIVRPFTLAVRLFANMFAGHIVLLVFTLGGFVLLNVDNPLVKPLSVLSWVLAIILTFFELLVAALQAYVFAILTASYIETSLSEEH